MLHVVYIPVYICGSYWTKLCVDLLFLLILLIFANFYPYRSLRDIHFTFFSLSMFIYTQDSTIFLILYELQSVLFFFLCLVWSTSTHPTTFVGARYHIAMTKTVYVFSLSAMCLFFYFTTGLSIFLLCCFSLKLAIFPSCYWLVEIHAQIPTQGSLLLSAIYVKLGWIGLLKYSSRSLIGTSGWGWIGEVWIILSCAGVFFLSFCLVCASTVKVFLAVQSALHTNLIFPYALMTPNTSELIGVSWAHSLSSGGLFLILSSVGEAMESKEFTCMYLTGVSMSVAVLAILSVICAPFTLGAKSEYGLLRHLVSVYPQFVFLHVVLMAVPKMVLTWLFFHYLMSGMVERRGIVTQSSSLSVLQGALCTNLYLYWCLL